VSGSLPVPAKTAAALADLDEACRIIDLAYHEGDVATLREIHDRAAALAVYHRSRDKANVMREVQVRAARNVGRLDLEAAPSKVRADRRPTSVVGTDVPELGVSTHTRAGWRKLGEVPDEEFGAHLDRLRADENTGITIAGAVRLARGRNIADSALMSSATDDWATPQSLFDALHREFSFTLDVCATPTNAKCARYFTAECDDPLAVVVSPHARCAAGECHPWVTKRRRRERRRSAGTRRGNRTHGF